MKLLLVHDHSNHMQVVARSLSRSGHSVITSDDPELATEMARSTDYDFIVIDELPEARCAAMCLQLRQRVARHTPIIMVSAQPGLQRRLDSFGVGADAHMEWPFDVDELEARFRAIRRRQIRSPRHLVVGDLVLDLDQFLAYKGSKPVHLPPLQFRLLQLLAERSPSVVRYDELEERAWGFQGAHPSALRDQIHKLRANVDKPFAHNTIQLVRLRGYRLVPGVSD